MALSDFISWLEIYSNEQHVWFVKRLSGNDTLANGSHQAGPYIPLSLLFKILPELDRPDEENPETLLNLYIDSHRDHKNARIVWYNNKLRNGSRNEARITRLGGQTSALLDPESTGALTVLAFQLDSNGTAEECHAWVCEHEQEEEQLENLTGPVEPGTWLTWSPGGRVLPNAVSISEARRTSCWLERHEMPEEWLWNFPTGAEIIRKTVELRNDGMYNPDDRLISRRDCEFELFRSLEETVEMPLISAGFANMKDFLQVAQRIIQRRKSRAGRSLELHIREIFFEERMREGEHFSFQPETEPSYNPDFVFPSEEAYRDPDFPEAKLRMLAVKSTCRERWHQILGEAERIKEKHLLTVQEGVSEKQFSQMREKGIKLVVPAKLSDKYPSSIRAQLVTLESFIAEIRTLQL